MTEDIYSSYFLLILGCEYLKQRKLSGIRNVWNLRLVLLLKNVEGISEHFIVKVCPSVANKSEI